MKTYIGTKVIEATPAIRKGGKVYLPNEAVPKTMGLVEEGYKVHYEDGYESWSPKDVFEKAYCEMEPNLDGKPYTSEQVRTVFDMIINWMKENNCHSGEHASQDDECQVNGIVLICELADVVGVPYEDD